MTYQAIHNHSLEQPEIMAWGVTGEFGSETTETADNGKYSVY